MVLADNWVRNGLEVAILVAVGGMLWQAVQKLRRGQIQVVRCAECGVSTSRAYPRCRWCGAEQPDTLTGHVPWEREG